MIGSPAARGAVASAGGAGRACLAAASAFSAVSAAIASITMAGARQRRIAPVDCAVNPLTILFPGSNAVRADVDRQARPFDKKRRHHHVANSRRICHVEVSSHVPGLVLTHGDRRRWRGRSRAMLTQDTAVPFAPLCALFLSNNYGVRMIGSALRF